MREIVVDNVIGYVCGCSKKGIGLEEWKFVKENGIVYVVNEKIGVKLRGKIVFENKK